MKFVSVTRFSVCCFKEFFCSFVIRDPAALQTALPEGIKKARFKRTGRHKLKQTVYFATF